MPINDVKVCSCRDLPARLHMKMLFDLLMGAVPGLDKPLCTLVASQALYVWVV